MTDEEIAAIRSHVDRWMSLDVGSLDLRNDVLALLEEREQLRNLVTALREERARSEQQTTAASLFGVAGDWATSVVNMLLRTARDTGESGLAFKSEEMARQVAALAGFMRLGVRDGYTYDISASQSDPVGKPHLWQVIIKRRDQEAQP